MYARDAARWNEQGGDGSTLLLERTAFCYTDSQFNERAIWYVNLIFAVGPITVRLAVTAPRSVQYEERPLFLYLLVEDISLVGCRIDRRAVV